MAKICRKCGEPLPVRLGPRVQLHEGCLARSATTKWRGKCKVCGAAAIRHRSGRVSNWCSKHYPNHKWAFIPVERSCALVTCTRTFMPSVKQQLFCSAACAMAAKRIRDKDWETKIRRRERLAAYKIHHMGAALPNEEYRVHLPGFNGRQ